MQRYTNLSGLFWVVCKLKLWKLKQTCDSSTVWGSSTWNMRWNFGLFSILFCFPSVSVQSMTVIWISVCTLWSARGILTWSHINGRQFPLNLIYNLRIKTYLIIYILELNCICRDWEYTVLDSLSLIYVLYTKRNQFKLRFYLWAIVDNDCFYLNSF